MDLLDKIAEAVVVAVVFEGAVDGFEEKTTEMMAYHR